MNEPVEIVANVIPGSLRTTAEFDAAARTALSALRDAGWRIVRTPTDDDLELPDDPDTALWIHVTEEWTP